MEGDRERHCPQHFGNDGICKEQRQRSAHTLGSGDELASCGSQVTVLTLPYTCSETGQRPSQQQKTGARDIPVHWREEVRMTHEVGLETSTGTRA